MKILLLQSYLRGSFGPIFPLGLAYLAAMLSAHEIKILDLNMENEPFLELENALTIFNPDVVGISLRNIDNTDRLQTVSFYEDFEVPLRKIKQISPRVRIIVGGAGFSMFAHEIMVRNTEIDFGIFQEAEESLPELLYNLDLPKKVKGIFYRHNSEILFSGQRDSPDFENLPFPRRDLFDLSKYEQSSYRIGVQSKRGCNLKCSYCNYPFLSGNKLRLRNPMSVVDEIQDLGERYQIKSFYFVDNVFNHPILHAEEICGEIIKRNLKVNWKAYFDIRFINENFLTLASKAGCKNFEFSPDGVSVEALKGLKKGISWFDIKKTVMFFKKNVNLKDSNVDFNFFINPPGETLFGLFQTLFIFMKINIILKKHGSANINWIRILPETEIYKITIEKRILSPHSSLLHKDYTELEGLFYSNPPLNKLDFLIKVAIKILKFVLKLRDKISSLKKRLILFSDDSKLETNKQVK